MDVKDGYRPAPRDVLAVEVFVAVAVGAWVFTSPPMKIDAPGMLRRQVEPSNVQNQPV